ncbi:uncharacterized protein [Spinacia oleracea]|uniref:FBD domain-containing protein n=1 Tax=Spinacia oleracea TaxID=3562 RepID=A0A9R0JP07_SPIOL|nr:uncharacterized protein LOC110781982 [Spinacia oleracea]
MLGDEALSNLGLVLEELYIDCPKLIYFRYSGCKKIPTFIYLNVPTTIQTSIRFNFSVPSGINSSWFISLNKFVEMIGVHQHVYLHLDVCRLELAEFILDEFEATQIFQNNVHLDLRIIYSCNIQNSVALVDGLIWSIHPSTLSIEGGCYEFIKDLCGKLGIKKSEDESCCEQQESCSKYWWHNIKDFEVKHQDKDMKEKLISLPELYQDYQGYKPRNKSCFKFHWRSCINLIQNSFILH